MVPYTFMYASVILVSNKFSSLFSQVSSTGMGTPQAVTSLPLDRKLAYVRASKRKVSIEAVRKIRSGASLTVASGVQSC